MGLLIQESISNTVGQWDIEVLNQSLYVIRQETTGQFGRVDIFDTSTSSRTVSHPVYQVDFGTYESPTGLSSIQVYGSGLAWDPRISRFWVWSIDTREIYKSGVQNTFIGDVFLLEQSGVSSPGNDIMTGFAYDGVDMWGLSTGTWANSSEEGVLHRFDTDVNVLETVPTGIGGVRGLAWDGDGFWTFNRDNVYKLDRNGSIIFQDTFAPLTGEWPKGAAFTGSTFWITHGSLISQIVAAEIFPISAPAELFATESFDLTIPVTNPMNTTAQFHIRILDTDTDTVVAEQPANSVILAPQQTVNVTSPTLTMPSKNYSLQIDLVFDSL